MASRPLKVHLAGRIDCPWTSRSQLQGNWEASLWGSITTAAKISEKETRQGKGKVSQVQGSKRVANSGFAVMTKDIFPRLVARSQTPAAHIEVALRVT